MTSAGLSTLSDSAHSTLNIYTQYTGNTLVSQRVVAAPIGLCHAFIAGFVSFGKIGQWFDGGLLLFFWDVFQ